MTDNLMKTIRAYLCYSCFSWLRPLYNSLYKKIVNKNDIDVEIISNEIAILTRQYQQLFDNYINDIMDLKTSDYFKAKKEIERINQLLTSGSSIFSGKFLICC